MKCKIYINNEKIKVVKNNGKFKIINPKVKIEKILESSINSSLKVGQVCENLILQRRYLISDVLKEKYECLDINNIRRGIFKPKYFLKTDVILSNNQNLEGIIWFENNTNLDEIYKNEVLNEIFDAQESYIVKQKQLKK